MKDGRLIDFKKPDGNSLEIGTETITLTSNYYEYYPETLTNQSDNSKKQELKNDNAWYEMIFGNTLDNSQKKSLYYLASSICECTNSGYYLKMLTVINNGCIGNDSSITTLFWSMVGDSIQKCGVRAVVSLNSDTKLVANGDNAWNIQ